MTRPTQDQIAYSMRVVTSAELFWDKPALRANAWETLLAAKGQRMDLAAVDRAQAERVNRGVA